ncbi:MAG: class I SAM-dependent methyltransferase [Actinomycetota bacterium]
MVSRIRFSEGDLTRFDVDGVAFRIGYQGESTRKELCIAKPLGLIEAYAQLLEDARPATIFELGISRGGSTALLALLAEPRKLVACELSAERVGALDWFIRERGLEERVRAVYGVDQADKERLGQIVEEEFDAPLDLVIDDASHLLDETIASFEVLFPRLRPGGLYVVEDWPLHNSYAHAVSLRAAEEEAGGQVRERPWLDDLGQMLGVDQPGWERPLSRFVLQLVLARSISGRAVADLAIDGERVVIRRGPMAIDPDGFRVTDIYADHFGLLR